MAALTASMGHAHTAFRQGRIQGADGDMRSNRRGEGGSRRRSKMQEEEQQEEDGEEEKL